MWRNHTVRARRPAALRWDWRLLFILGGVGALMTGAGMGAGKGAGETVTGPGWPGTAPPVAVALSVEPLATGGEPRYLFVLGAMATGEETAVVTFRNGQTYDFVVVQDGEEIWRWSQGRVFHQAIQQRRWPPGELVIFTAVWDGRDAAGRPVTGTVEVHGTLTSDPPLAAEAVTLRLP